MRHMIISPRVIWTHMSSSVLPQFSNCYQDVYSFVYPQNKKCETKLAECKTTTMRAHGTHSCLPLFNIYKRYLTVCYCHTCLEIVPVVIVSNMPRYASLASCLVITFTYQAVTSSDWDWEFIFIFIIWNPGWATKTINTGKLIHWNTLLFKPLKAQWMKQVHMQNVSPHYVLQQTFLSINKHKLGFWRITQSH